MTFFSFPPFPNGPGAWPPPTHGGRRGGAPVPPPPPAPPVRSGRSFPGASNGTTGADRGPATPGAWRLGRAMVNVGVRVSGGDLLLGSLHGLTVAEADALDHLGQPLRAVQPAPAALGGLGELVDHRQGRLP